MGMVIGGLVGWYLASSFCMPVSSGATVNYPCGTITQLAGPISTQSAIGIGLGMLVGSMIGGRR